MNRKILKRMALNMVLSIGTVGFAAISAPTAPADSCKEHLCKNKFVTKSVTVGDSVISYNVSKRNDKKTIILQHGAFMNNVTMMGLADLFKDYNVIVPDMANHGKSVSPFEIDSVDTYADIEYNFILKLIEIGEIEKDSDITYAGWSLGGSIGMEIAIKDKIINKMILISSSPIWKTIPDIPADQFAQIFRQMFMGTLSKDVTPERLDWIKKNFNLMLSSVPVSEKDITAADNFNVIDKLSSINIPVLMISGEQDPLALPAEQLEMVKDIPNSKLVIIGDESHAMVVGCPEKVYDEINQFLSSFSK